MPSLDPAWVAGLHRALRASQPDDGMARGLTRSVRRAPNDGHKNCPPGALTTVLFTARVWLPLARARSHGSSRELYRSAHLPSRIVTTWTVGSSRLEGGPHVSPRARITNRRGRGSARRDPEVDTRYPGASA
jgi:hypothetical protein